MEKYKNLEVFTVEFDDTFSVFNNVAIVTIPAIEEFFIRMSKEDENIDIKMKLDEDRHIVSGPVLIPNLPILRERNGEKFYVKYTTDTIERMAINFFQTHRNTEGNVEHAYPVQGVTFFESYLLDKNRGIVPKEFASLPDGTWIMSAKIENEEVWKLVKDGTLNGFSIDISNIGLRQKKEVDEIGNVEELLEYIKNN